MTLFLIIGAVGIAVILLSLIVGDLFDTGLGDYVGTEVIGAFLGAFGFVGALALGLTGQVAAGLVAGLAAGVLLGAGAGWASRRLRGPDHSNAMRTSDLLECRGQVLAAIPADGFGVVSLSVGGHPTRVNARSPTPLAQGTDVVVVEVLSPTAVRVVPLFDTERSGLP